MEWQRARGGTDERKRRRSRSVTSQAFRSVTGAALMLLAVAVAVPAAADPGGALVFSSLCTTAAGGDIVGIRVKITGAPPDIVVSFEETEGALMVATETKEATFVPETGALAFTLRTEAGTVGFRGRATPTLMAGTLTREGSDPEEIRIPSDRGGDGEGPCSPTTAPAKP